MCLLSVEGLFKPQSKNKVKIRTSVSQILRFLRFFSATIQLWNWEPQRIQLYYCSFLTCCVLSVSGLQQSDLTILYITLCSPQLSVVTKQYYCGIIGSIPQAALSIPETALFDNWKFVPFNLLCLLLLSPPSGWPPPVCSLYLWACFCFVCIKRLGPWCLPAQNDNVVRHISWSLLML